MNLRRREPTGDVKKPIPAPQAEKSETPRSGPGTKIAGPSEEIAQGGAPLTPVGDNPAPDLPPFIPDKVAVSGVKLPAANGGQEVESRWIPADVALMRGLQPRPAVSVPRQDRRVEALGARPARRALWAGYVFWLMNLVLGVVAVAAVYVILNPPAVSGLPGLNVPPQVNLPRFERSIPGLAGPVGIAVSSDGSRLFVAEGEGQREVKALDREGHVLYTLNPPGTSAGQRSPTYIALDDQGQVYVSDRYQRTIYVYDRAGQFVDAILAPDLRLATYVATQTGKDYVRAGARLEFQQGMTEVNIQDQGGKVLATVEAPTYTPWAPLAVTFAQGRLFVSDVTRGHHRIMIFEPDGKLTLEFGAEGGGEGEFSYPNGIAVDREGQIYVSDSNNGRVQFFSPKGEFLGMMGGMGLPRGLGIDGSNRLYVADAMNHHLRVLDIQDRWRTLGQLGSYSPEEGRFNFPNAIAFDNADHMYVVDRVNNRVQVWTNNP